MLQAAQEAFNRGQVALSKELQASLISCCCVAAPVVPACVLCARVCYC